MRLLESAVLGIALVMAATGPTTSKREGQQKDALETSVSSEPAFDPNTTIGKAQLVLEVKDRKSFDSLVKSTNGQMPFSVILSTELLKGKDGKPVADAIVASNGAITPILRLDTHQDKKWSSMNVNQQIKTLQNFFAASNTVWQKRFKGVVPVKYVYGPPNLPADLLTLLEQGNLKVVLPNVNLDQVYAAQPTSLNAAQNTLVIYHNAGGNGKKQPTKGKESTLSSIMINVQLKLVKEGFELVNANGYYNNVPTTKNAASTEVVKTSNGKEVLVDPKMVDGLVKNLLGQATSLNPKELTNVFTATDSKIEEVKKTIEDVKKSTEEVKSDNTSITDSGKKTEEITKKTEVKKTEEVKKNSKDVDTKKEDPKNADPKKDPKKQDKDEKKEGDTKAENAKKDTEATEEGGISGTTIGIIIAVVVAVLILLAVAYKKMKN